jgi:hypothetical protein
MSRVDGVALQSRRPLSQFRKGGGKGSDLSHEFNNLGEFAFVFGLG